MAVTLADQDAAAAFGITAILAGHFIAEAVPSSMFEAVRTRFVKLGLAAADADQAQLGNACDRLAGRLRVAAEQRT